MKFDTIQRDWEVFAEEGKPAVGAVRQIARDHAVIYIEGFGDIHVSPHQIGSVHDGKVILLTEGLSDRVQTAIRHAHDREPR